MQKKIFSKVAYKRQPKIPIRKCYFNDRHANIINYNRTVSEYFIKILIFFLEKVPKYFPFFSLNFRRPTALCQHVVALTISSDDRPFLWRVTPPAQMKIDIQLSSYYVLPQLKCFCYKAFVFHRTTF